MAMRRASLLALAAVGVAAASVAALGPGAGPVIEMARSDRMLLGERMDDLVGHLRAFRAANGRYPTNDEGLGALPAAGEPVDLTGEPRPGRRTAYSHGRIVNGAFVLLRDEVGPVTPWLLPYLYENRAAAPAGAFAGSPVDDDRDRRWSRRADDGVFVWCVEARALARRERALRTVQWAVAGGGLALAAAAAMLLRRSHRREGLRWSRTGAAVVLLVLLAAAGTGPVMAAFEPKGMRIRFPLRDRPPLAVECEEAIRDYRDSGAITPETCGRLLDGIRTSGDRICEAERRPGGE